MVDKGWVAGWKEDVRGRAKLKTVVKSDSLRQEGRGRGRATKRKTGQQGGWVGGRTLSEKGGVELQVVKDQLEVIAGEGGRAGLGADWGEREWEGRAGMRAV